MQRLYFMHLHKNAVNKSEFRESKINSSLSQGLLFKMEPIIVFGCVCVDVLKSKR